MQQVKARGNVENWLCLVEESMVVSLRRLTKSSIGDFESKLRHEWATQHPSQVSIMMYLLVCIHECVLYKIASRQDNE